MTGPEREDFRELRSEIRDSFGEIKDSIDTLSSRVHSLELARAADDAVRADRMTLAARLSAERRWKAGLAFGVGTSVAIGVVNFLMEHQILP